MLVNHDGKRGRGSRDVAYVVATKVKREFSSLPWRGMDGDAARVSLHDLVHDGEAKSGAAWEAGLERLEDVVD